MCLVGIWVLVPSACTCLFLHTHDLLANHLANHLVVLVLGLVPPVGVVVVVGIGEEDQDVGWH